MNTFGQSRETSKGDGLDLSDGEVVMSDIEREAFECIERIGEIERSIAEGKMNAAQVFTQMRQLIPDRTQQGEAEPVARVIEKRLGSGALIECLEPVELGADLYTNPPTATAGRVPEGWKRDSVIEALIDAAHGCDGSESSYPIGEALREIAEFVESSLIVGDSISQWAIMEAFEYGYYEAAGADAWYADHDNGNLKRDTRCYERMQACLRRLLAAALSPEQPKPRNRYGVDAPYFHGKLSLVLRDLENYTSDELARSLARLVVVADKDVLAEPEFTPEQSQAAKDSAIQQAQIWAQEARTQKAIVAEIGALVGCDKDYELVSSVKAALGQAAPGSGWIRCSERLPEIPKDAPAYAQEVRCLVTTESGDVVEAKYTVNAYAKTEKGRAPRWEWGGRICPWKVYAWMPLPEGLKRPNPPAEDK